MKTISVFRKPAYLVSFGDKDEYIEFDLVAHIIKDAACYSLKIVKAEISTLTMPFAAQMFMRLSEHEQSLYHSLFREMITKDMEPYLHSYYHEGELLNGTESEAV